VTRVRGVLIVTILIVSLSCRWVNPLGPTFFFLLMIKYKVFVWQAPKEKVSMREKNVKRLKEFVLKYEL
jgi:hypothetical protein